MVAFKQEEISVMCPYCGENIFILVDCSLSAQRYYEDCSVCCAPILFNVEIQENGTPSVWVQRDDE